MDDIRTRFLRDRVMTATPAQRVVLLYDRLVLDLARARDAQDAGSARPHLEHAGLILSELAGSLDRSAGGPAAGLSDIYHFALREVLSAQLSGFTPALATLTANLSSLRDAWRAIADGEAGEATAPSAVATSVPAGAVSGGLSLTA